jgi:FtsP/CotA-like multicopper oxidase with cupredoxin domain
LSEAKKPPIGSSALCRQPSVQLPGSGLRPSIGGRGSRSSAHPRSRPLQDGRCPSDHIVFNGRASQYAAHPIDVRPNELLRLYLVNAGPNRISSFHVVGGIFERVFEDGSQANPLIGVQTVNVPVGGGSIFEVRRREPGDYPFVTHAFADATKGAVGVFRAVGAGEPAAGSAAH